jgi:hypothetical protein
MSICSRTELEERLREIIYRAVWFDTLKSIREIGLADWWIAGGAVRNTTWMQLFPDNCTLSIKDLDVVFFDKNTGKETELEAKNLLHTKHKEWVFDVKNQSSFGVWRPWHFVFQDTTDGIAHFLNTATAIGITLDNSDNIQIFQPYGLNDLFNGILRSTPYSRGSKAALAKQNELLNKCPSLRIEED